MNIIDHGKWVAYKPAQLPPNAPANALFAKRESDGVDWYDYVNSGENFREDSVKIAAVWRDYAGGFVIGPAVRDPTLIFPAGHIVVEITDYRGDDPQEEFRNRLLDPRTGTITDQREMTRH